MHVRNFVRFIVVGSLIACLGLAPGTFGIPAFTGSTDWIGGRPLGPRDLEGKVVLVDFWEYTCLNCLRTLPYLRTWYARYHDDGFVIVGVHTPEFGFSGDAANVEAATHRLGITWPVALDDNDQIWSRYANDSWPNEYLFDQDGRLVDTVTGEGRYQETEAKIQSLLKEKNSKLVLPPVMALLPQDDYEKPGARCYLKTPEVILGRTKVFESVPAGQLADGSIYLDGAWHRNRDSAVSTGTNESLALRYHAVQVAAVIGNAHGAPVRLDVTQDGVPVARGDAGADLAYDQSGMSYVNVDAPRAYDLIMNAKMNYHVLRLLPHSPGANIYSFDFESCEIPATSTS